MKKSSLFGSKRPMILIVEDDLIMQMVYENYFQKLALSTVIVSTGEKALACIAVSHYDAMVLDLGLSDQPGEAVIEKVRAQEQEKNIHLPIIVATAHGDIAKLNQCLLKGADAVLIKPVSLAVFRDTLASLINLK